MPMGCLEGEGGGGGVRGEEMLKLQIDWCISLKVDSCFSGFPFNTLTLILRLHATIIW